MQNDEQTRAENRRKYADIIDKDWRQDMPNAASFFAKHPHMLLSNRAKAYAPFAALRGHGERLDAEKEKLMRISRSELSEEDAFQLSNSLSRLKKGMQVAARYFIPDPAEPELGYCAEKSGTLCSIDLVNQGLRIGNTDIAFDALIQIDLLES